jgi:eukaryotic-like serine/threonine-protein kinase
MIGSTLLHYRILDALGAGGMGEVFVAHDTKLDRKVALKVLPAAVAGDFDRRERFAREARAVAALNHPNIVTVYSVEEAPSTGAEQAGVHFLTMELVEGRTLADVLPAGGLPLDQLLKLAIPLADAVSAAHEKGITHRDLKPANVMVTGEGRVEVLDFGLAKLRDAGRTGESVMTAIGPQPLTGEGRIVGTVSYMSPEQAEGRPVDHRSDIFSLGVMLYEMATGDRPFKGDSNVSTLSSILRDTPRPVSEVRPGLPRDLVRIVRRALTKDPEHRYQSAKDLRNDLEELKQDLDSGELAAAAPSSVSARGEAGVPWLWMGVGTVILAGGGLALWSMWPGDRAPAAPDVSFTKITSAAGIESTPSLSPDGRWIVYASGADIFLQSVGGQTSINLTQDAANDFHPAFSPDGELIAFGSTRGEGGVFVMTKTGESVRRLARLGYYPTWTPDGRFVVFSSANFSDPDDRITVSEGWKVEVATGDVVRLTEGDFMQPAVSPGGHRIAYWSLPVTAEPPLRFTGGTRDLWTMRGDGGDPVRVTDDGATDWSPIWSPGGEFLYFASDRGGSMNLWRVPIDEASGRVLGPPQAITTPAPWLGFLSRSADGQRFAYASFEFRRNVARVPFDPARGVVTGPIEPITSGTLDWARPDVSPDGEAVAFSSYRRQEDLFVARRDASGGWRITQLTSDAAKDRSPVWSPDGRQLAYYSDRGGAFSFWTIHPDASSVRQRVAMPGGLVFPVWSPDGSRVAATDLNLRRNYVFALGDGVASEPALTFAPPPDPATAFWSWSWSADDRIVGWAGLPNVVWVYSFETQEYVRIAPGRMPAWLNDWRRIVYGFEGRLRLADTVTKQTREVFALDGEVLDHPRLSRDNRFLYFTHATTDADIWLMTIR